MMAAIGSILLSTPSRAAALVDVLLHGWTESGSVYGEVPATFTMRYDPTAAPELSQGGNTAFWKYVGEARLEIASDTFDFPNLWLRYSVSNGNELYLNAFNLDPGLPPVPGSVFGYGGHLTGSFYGFGSTVGLPQDSAAFHALFQASAVGANYLQLAGVTNISFVSTVPEPATWAMVILGFGLVGGGMRSARRKTTVSYA